MTNWDLKMSVENREYKLTLGDYLWFFGSWLADGLAWVLCAGGILGAVYLLYLMAQWLGIIPAE